MNQIENGTELAPKTFKINRQLLIDYANASGDQNPIHQDEAFAKSVGLPDVIAHGMLTMALAGKYLSDISGSQKPVVVPAGVDVSLIISGKVIDINDGIAKIELLAMCNEVKVLGMAKGSIKI